MKKFQEIDKLNLSVKDSIESRLLSLEQNTVSHESKLNNNKNLLTELYSKVDTLLIKQTEVENVSSDLNTNKVDIKDFAILKKYITDDLYHTKQNIEQIYSKFRENDNYIEFYKPAKEFKEMTNLLSNVLTKESDRERLKMYVKSNKDKYKEKIEKNKNGWLELDKKLLESIEIPEIEVDWLQKQESPKPKKKPRKQMTKQVTYKSGTLIKAEEYMNKKGKVYQEVTMSILSKDFKKFEKKFINNSKRFNLN